MFVGVAFLPACGDGVVYARQPARRRLRPPAARRFAAIFPTVGVGARVGVGVFYPSQDGGDVWSLECDWNDSSDLYLTSVGLYLEGALTRQGDTDLDVDFNSIGGGPMQGTPVSGVGDEALYFNNSMGAQFLEARAGSYYVEVLAFELASPVTEAQLQPLVQKVISGL